jgi:hypothetical protein
MLMMLKESLLGDQVLLFKRIKLRRLQAHETPTEKLMHANPWTLVLSNRENLSDWRNSDQ